VSLILLSLSHSSVLLLFASACFNADHPPVKSLEEYIVLQAAGFGFQLETIIRPNDISVQEPASRENDNVVLNTITLPEMQEVGAAVLVFQRN
jgi:hypothetical protein